MAGPSFTERHHSAPPGATGSNSAMNPARPPNRPALPRPVLPQQRRQARTPTPQPRSNGIGHRHAPASTTQRHHYHPQVQNHHRPSVGQRRNVRTQQIPIPQPRFGHQNGSGVPHGAVSLSIYLANVPIQWTTETIYTELCQYGEIDKIDIPEVERTDFKKATVTFAPAPPDGPWLREGIPLETRSGTHGRIEFTYKYHQPYYHQSPANAQRMFPELIQVPISQLEFGVMKAANTMLGFPTMQIAGAMLDVPTSNRTKIVPKEVVFNSQRNQLDICFSLITAPSRSTRRSRPNSRIDGAPSPDRKYKIRFNLAQLRPICQLSDSNSGRKSWVLSTMQPPLLLRKTLRIRETHDPKARYWNDHQTWKRQTGIDRYPGASQNAIIQLENANDIVNIGRCLTYKLVFEERSVTSAKFTMLQQALQDHSVPIHVDRAIDVERNTAEFLWNWFDTSAAQRKSSTLSDMNQLTREIIHLDFTVRYQLEVCISQGILHECNITKEFLAKVAKSDPKIITKVLEKAVDAGERCFDPEEIFRRFLHKTNFVQKFIPSSYATIRSATITPTTVYFMTPMMETSNRVVRKYRHLEDRFLRVKFTDEKYKGRVHSSSDGTMNKVYDRIERALNNGIHVGGRCYEFLAFGNSQFREHGAWFFAPTGDLTADKIRKDLGDFDSIKVVAKYASRIGQCFSTTKSTCYTVRVQEIPDIMVRRNGQEYCFTDGVGKVSLALAQLIAQQLSKPGSKERCPSTFQFRYQGCKGILVVDPKLKDIRIQIRPSQNKFQGAYHQGLEIVRLSQFATSYLNIQLILVLSALGVEDDVFVGKMKQMLSDLQRAMYDENKALELLTKYVDYNRMTLELVKMIVDGFMGVRDPFTISCLHLWRAWSLKYLKEKARIFVDEGAFVLGCVDETGTLRGHYDKDKADDHDVSKLPQIFLQTDVKNDGNVKVIKGVCMLMRNPSLHPGDIRVVLAVDVPALHHIRNCVVLPSTGDRDVANMCSGGDLDGDDYLVIWDEALMVKEWNHPPMDFQGPPVQKVDKVTVEDMTDFFVTHMKHDRLGLIAVAHKYWADREFEGVKSPKCIQLAALHSTAVDFAKTGTKYEMPKDLHVTLWPHWSEVKNKPQGKIYNSRKVIGQLYDAVQRVPFVGMWHLAFDKRIIEAYALSSTLRQSAREAKQLYDEGVRQIMTKYAIGNEFEVWTTFVMEHSDDVGDYKFAETIGEAANALKEAHQKLCYEHAGTNEVTRDWKKMGPFVAAMYVVTAEEIGQAMRECKRKQMVGGQWVPVKVPKFDNMPFMSFPWLFQAELGKIANSGMRDGVSDDGNIWLDGEAAYIAEDNVATDQWDEVPLSRRPSSSQGDVFANSGSASTDALPTNENASAAYSD